MNDNNDLYPDGSTFEYKHLWQMAMLLDAAASQSETLNQSERDTFLDLRDQLSDAYGKLKDSHVQ